MSRPYFSVKHVESYSTLPKKLTPGRIYFVDDEQTIVIDHGDGFPPVIYGGKPGPMGPSGEPQPHLQDQIDTLAQTELNMQAFIWQEGEKLRESLKRIEGQFNDTFSFLRQMVDTNAKSVITLASTIKNSFDKYDSAIATLSKAVANLYPDPQWHGDDYDPDNPQGQVLAQTLQAGQQVSHDGAVLQVLSSDKGKDGSLTLTLRSKGDFSDTTDPLDFETLTTNAGSWTIQQSNLRDGSTAISLTAQPSRLDTLNDGDTFSAGDESYTVSGITRSEDGTISVVLH